MKYFFLSIIFLPLVFFTEAINIYISPYDPTSPCNGAQNCDGTSVKPFDDIGFAFQHGASSCNCPELTFNLITDPNAPNNRFFFNGSTTVPFSPFESFTGS